MWQGKLAAVAQAAGRELSWREGGKEHLERIKQ